MSECVVCGDNRFDLIAKYKAKLTEATNIGSSPDEMAVIDNILFRMWQMGWLDKLEKPVSPWHRGEDELPEIGKIVLVYDNWDRLSICQLDNQYRWLRQGGGWFDVPYVRYWMPIEPPKEDA